MTVDINVATLRLHSPFLGSMSDMEIFRQLRIARCLLVPNRSRKARPLECEQFLWDTCLHVETHNASL